MWSPEMSEITGKSYGAAMPAQFSAKGYVMSEKYNSTTRALLQAISIKKGLIPVEEVPDMPCRTLRVPEGTDVDKLTISLEDALAEYDALFSKKAGKKNKDR